MHDRGKPELSPLAAEILVRVTDGQTIKAIASDLGTTRDVVDYRLRTIYRQLRVKGVAQLVHAAISKGWIELSGQAITMGRPAIPDRKKSTVPHIPILKPAAAPRAVKAVYDEFHIDYS